MTICLAYLNSILFFASIYRWLFTKNYNHFLFNADLLRHQKAAVQTQLERELNQIKKTLDNLQHLSTAIATRKCTTLTESAPGDVLLYSGVRYTFQPCGGGGLTIPMTLVSMFDENGNRRDEYLPIIWRAPIYPEQFLEVTRQGIKYFNQAASYMQSRLDSIFSDSPQVWGVWDFLYFSVGIQAALGLGDILPNSTTVRRIVALQVMVGITILTVALNLVLNSCT